MDEKRYGKAVDAPGGGTRAKRPRSRRAEPSGAASKPLHVLAYEKIKNQIITLHFRPGEYLNEAQVSKSLKIGRTPVHQALNRLMIEGMVAVIPRKGVIVKGVSLNDVMEIIDVRLINETYCARLAAARADDRDIAAMARILDEADKAVAASDVERQMMLDSDFHGTLSRAAKNEVLADLMRSLHDRSLRFWFISLRDASHHQAVMDQHRAILEAIRARDPDAASAAVRDHIESFRRNVARHV